MKDIKKSLQEAIERGRKASIESPELTVWVMDKKYQRSAVHTCEWVHDEKILDGWHDVIIFKNGEAID
ncbi:MAG: hypothetical protein K2H01_07455 [Ruminococcus sp.]|nr:hypothetical protein [Ruminococcus sp.]